MVRAVILAAGASSRMGRPKAGLTLGPTGETFLTRIIRHMIDAGIPDIVVVTGAAAEAVRDAAQPVRAPIRFEHNPRWSDGQLSSLVAGLRPRQGDVVESALVTLVDTPFVRADTIRLVVSTWRVRRPPIVRPARGEVHGHPVLFDGALFQELRDADPRVGAKAIVRAYANQIVNVPVQDDGAFRDVDTPDEYEVSLREMPSRGSALTDRADE